MPPPRAIRYLSIGAGLVVLWIALPELWVLWSLTFANLLVKDNFPFSHFPLYSSHRDTNDYFFLTDEREQPIPARKFRIGAASLKKIFNAEIRAERKQGLKIGDLTQERRAQAGRRTLEAISQTLSRGAGRYRFLRLNHVSMRAEGDSIQSESEVVAELKIR